MPQRQEKVPLQFLDNETRYSSATGNNAAWLCPCGFERPLVGRSGLAKGPTEGYIVVCPKCTRQYFVVPDGGDLKVALRVEEVASKK